MFCASILFLLACVRCIFSWVAAFNSGRPHPNECSGGDLDGDLFFVSWEEDLVPSHIETPMDYTARRPRIMDHDVTLEVICAEMVIISIKFKFPLKNDPSKTLHLDFRFHFLVFPDNQVEPIIFFIKMQIF